MIPFWKTDDQSSIRFYTFIEMEFPEFPVIAALPEEGLLAALGLSAPLFVGKTRDYFLIETNDQRSVESVSPRFDELKTLNVAGVFVTARSDSAKYDFVSRCFFPKEGIPEDPVTGSAHCSLGPYWRERLSKQRLVAKQISSENGEIQIRFNDSKVILGGKARIRPSSKMTSPAK